MGDSKDPGNTPTLEISAADYRWPRGIAYSGGFVILGAPICFGNAAGAGVRFISTLDDRLPRRGGSIIANRFIASALGAEARGLDALSLDFGQKIRFGKMELRIFSSGLGPGSAQLQVTYKGSRILYCGGMCLRRPISTSAAEVPKCDLLLMDAAPADSRPASPGRVAGKLASWAGHSISLGRTPVIAVGSIGAAFDALFALRPLDAVLRAQRPVFEMFRRVEPLGGSSPNLKRLEQKLPRAEIVMAAASSWPRFPLYGEPFADLAYVGPGSRAPSWASASFRLGEGEDRSGLLAYAKLTGASEVALGERCDARTASLLSRAGITSYYLRYPRQIAFPF